MKSLDAVINAKENLEDEAYQQQYRAFIGDNSDNGLTALRN